MMTMIFQFSQNSHTHRIVVNEKDVLLEWKRMKGDAFVKVRFTKCIIPKGSEVTTNHGKAISGKAIAERNKFLSSNSTEASKIAGSGDIDWKYETLTQDHEMSDKKGSR